MSLFPRIARPCPYIDRLDQVIDADFCRMCRREVHDLTAMDDAARADFLSACGGDACISYVAMVPAALAATLIAASAAVPAAAHPHPARVRHPHVAAQPVPIMLAGAPLPVPLEAPPSSVEPAPPPAPPAPAPAAAAPR